MKTAYVTEIQDKAKAAYTYIYI